MTNEGLEPIYLMLGTFAIMGGALGLMIHGMRQEGKKRAEQMFCRAYKAALTESEERFSPSKIGDLGSLVRLYRDQVKEVWVDGDGHVREVDPLATEPLNVYYGFGSYNRSNVIAAITKNATRYDADAYSLSPRTLNVHRDTVLSAMFFRIVEQDN